jgi:glucosamine-6-phosphate deaminase
MEVVILPSAAEAALAAARVVAACLRSSPRAVLGLPTGLTPERVYAELVRLHREEALDFSTATTFNLDELVGVDERHPASYRRYMREHLFRHVNIPPERALVPDGRAADVDGACATYEDAIRAAGGIDLQLLGLGANAHLGFNEPGSSLASRTRVKTLSDETLAANGEGLPAVVRQRRLAITMGLGTILDARTCLCIATGPAKAGAVAATVEGPVTASAPGSVLQLHPDAIAYVDEAAAAGLLRRRYYLDAEARERQLERGE